MPLQPTLIQRDGSGWIGNIGDVLLQCYAVPAEIGLMKKRQALEIEFMERTKPKKYIVGTIVLEPAIAKLSPEHRTITTEHSKVTAPFTRAGFLVLVAPGFKASIIRGMIGSILLVTGAGFPFKVTGEAGEAFDFVAPHLELPMTRADVQRAYDELARAP
jgi:hypothetical protein